MADARISNKYCESNQDRAGHRMGAVADIGRRIRIEAGRDGNTEAQRTQSCVTWTSRILCELFVFVFQNNSQEYAGHRMGGHRMRVLAFLEKTRPLHGILWLVFGYWVGERAVYSVGLNCTYRCSGGRSKYFNRAGQSHPSISSSRH